MRRCPLLNLLALLYLLLLAGGVALWVATVEWRWLAERITTWLGSENSGYEIFLDCGGDEVLIFIFLFSPIVPAWCVMTAINHIRRRRERATLALCQGCGYDLRATPDRCPECGAMRAEENGDGPRDRIERAEVA